MSNWLRYSALKLHHLLTGRQVLTHLEELNRAQWLDRETLFKLQYDKLRRVVEYAYHYVPYYKHTFDQVGFNPDNLRSGLDAMYRLPVLTKDIINRNFYDLLTTEPGRRARLSKSTTSGSTGRPLTFMQDNDHRDHATADIQRHLGWAGWKMGQLHAYIWGANFEVSTQESMRTRLLDWTWNRFLTNAFLLTDESLTGFTERVYRQRPKLLFGFASSLHRFAQFVRQHRRYHGITFNGIFSSGEVLLPEVRQFIEETFRCRVFNRYGTRELGGIACECEAHTGLHVSAENNHVEIINDAGQPARPGEIGNIIVTNLNNLGMPFIRYCIEDAGAWYVGGDCPCGRTAPVLEVLHGRIADTFKTRDGGTVWGGFSAAAYRSLAHPSIKQFQIIQKSLDLMIVRLVKANDIPQSVLDRLVKTIQTVFGGNVRVQFEFPEHIPVLPCGKHRYAISELKDQGE